MAIISSVMTEYGIQATYSKISMFSENETSIVVQLKSYLTVEDRQQGKKPIKTSSYSIPKDTDGLIDQEGMNHIRYAYIKLIQAYGFEGDEDVSQWIVPEETEVTINGEYEDASEQDENICSGEDDLVVIE